MSIADGHKPSLHGSSTQFPTLHTVCVLGWLFGTSSNKKKKKAKSSSYVDPAEKAQALKEGRAVDLAALLELKQLIHHSPDSFFSTWEENGNPCNFAKVPQASLHMGHALHQSIKVMSFMSSHAAHGGICLPAAVSHNSRACHAACGKIIRVL